MQRRSNWYWANHKDGRLRSFYPFTGYNTCWCSWVLLPSLMTQSLPIVCHMQPFKRQRDRGRERKRVFVSFQRPLRPVKRTNKMDSSIIGPLSLLLLLLVVGSVATYHCTCTAGHRNAWSTDDLNYDAATSKGCHYRADITSYQLWVKECKKRERRIFDDGHLRLWRTLN